MRNNAAAVESLEPRPVWQFFAEIADVPRPSKREEKIRAHLRKVAEERGFSVREDDVGNMVIAAPASRGRENAPTIVLQGHVDMVCEKNAGTEHDFDNEGIRLVLDQDADTGEQIVRGAGTTLGADNGIGVALGLAVATAPDVNHGPLEILLTVDEEMGMTGASALKPGFITGKTLINLDAEEDDYIYIGCAGGGDCTLTWSCETRPVADNRERCRVNVKGLRGGHSGGDIHENRGNANKVLVRLLRAADVEGLQFCSISGGSKRNALAREAHAILAGPSGLADALRQAAETVHRAVVHESAEPNLKIEVEPVGAADAPNSLSAADSQNLLLALEAIPHGVLEMHPQVPDLVQTSNNLATITMDQPSAGQARIVVGCLARSSLDGRVPAVWSQLDAIGQLAGAEVETGNSYPGWEPKIDSPLLTVCRQVYEQLFNEKPNVTAIHAGLECGIIGQRVGELDMVSFGPRIRGAHSPDERVWPASVEKSYKFLQAVLEALAKS